VTRPLIGNLFTLCVHRGRVSLPIKASHIPFFVSPPLLIMASLREQELLSVGAQCSHQSCLLVDFLPFKCQHCEDSFCQEHFMVTAHKCPKYDESKYNRVSPNCPLCNVVVSVRPGQDPNEAVEAHFMKDCSIMTGRTKAKKSTPICARARCGKALFAPIRCTVSVSLETSCGPISEIPRNATNNFVRRIVFLRTIVAPLLERRRRPRPLVPLPPVACSI
jgi:hypothetical protein